MTKYFTTNTALLTTAIKEIRLKRNYSQVDIADELDLTPSAYCKIENSNAILQLENLFNICSIFDMTVSDLVSEAEIIGKLLIEKGIPVCRTVKGIPVDKPKDAVFIAASEIIKIISE